MDNGKVKTGIDWQSVKAELDQAEWEEDEDGNTVRQVYLGSVFSLMPSGKYYTPWAHSNVQVCEACAQVQDLPCDEISPCVKPEPLRLGQAYYDTVEGFTLDSDGDWQDATEGQGDYHCEACADAMTRQALEDEAQAAGLWVTSGEGDPTDIFIGQTK